MDAFTRTPAGRKLYHWRKETVEGSFAEGKENHGLRTTRMLGRANMQKQSFLTVAVQNMKRIARFRFTLCLRLHFRLKRCEQCLKPGVLPDVRIAIIGLHFIRQHGAQCAGLR